MPYIKLKRSIEINNTLNNKRQKKRNKTNLWKGVKQIKKKENKG